MNHCNSSYKKAVSLAFSRAVNQYDRYAEVQQYAGKLLLSQLNTQHKVDLILDLGMGTGILTQQLKQFGQQVVGLDLSMSMLSYARCKRNATYYICADFDEMPFANERFDVIYSNLALQWSLHFEATVDKLLALLKPQGRLFLSTLGADSLSQIRETWQKQSKVPPVNHFFQYEQLQEICHRFKGRIFKQDHTLLFDSFRQVCLSLKGIGATHLQSGRSNGLLSPRQFEQLAQNYPCEQGSFPLSYELIFMEFYRG